MAPARGSGLLLPLVEAQLIADMDEAGKLLSSCSSSSSYEQQQYLSECSSLAPADWLIPNNIGSNDKRSNRLSSSNSSNTCCLTWAIVAATCQLHLLLLLLLLLERQQHVVYQVPTDFIMCCCCCCQRQLSSGKFRAIGMPTTKCRETKATATTNAYIL